MTYKFKLLGAVALCPLGLAATPAFAAGTQAGTTITNQVTVNYQVSGVSQTAQTAANTVTVDRKVNLTMTTAAATTSSAPGSTAQVTGYTLTNTSNDTLDFILSVAQQSNGATAQHGGTDAFDTSNVKIYLDNNANGSVDGGDTLITYVDEIAPDTTKNILVVSDIPIAQSNGQVAGVVLAAQAAAGGSSGNQGAVLSATAGANTAGVDNVLADTAGATDAANDGKYSVKGDYTVSAPVLTITKVSTLISDPINNGTNPKAIPGATLEYCIVVANAAGAATATNVGVSDALPSTIAYSSVYGIFLNGTATGTAPNYTCNADGAAGGTYTAGTTTVAGTLNNLAAGSTATVRFRATIN